MKKRYKNLDNIENNNSWDFFCRWAKERAKNKKDLRVTIPSVAESDIEKIKHNEDAFSITWIGHSSFLIQLGGVNILTDPVFAKRMGLQKRLTKPGLEANELPDIDIVLISHGHYDHLDFPSLRKIKGNPTFYVPSGLKPLFQKKGYQHVHEANWWDNFSEGDLSISFVPAQHWTKRSLLDTNTSHWGGWIVEDKVLPHSVYFVGDTGYFRGFKEIEKRFELDVVLMPIGAYEPEWFMSISHINPEDAVKAFLELNGKTFIPMHYGAFRLADDTGPEALERLENEWKRLGLPPEKLCVLKVGETTWSTKNLG